MDEILLLERAKAYMDMLSKGIDPISGEAVQSDSALNNERLQKCFAYVGGVLQKVIDNQGKVVAVSEKQAFFISEDSKRHIILNDTPVTSAEFVKKVNQYIDVSAMKKLSSAPIYKWLLERNFLEEVKVPVQSFKKERILTELSKDFGVDIRKTVVKTTAR